MRLVGATATATAIVVHVSPLALTGRSKEKGPAEPAPGGVRVLPPTETPGRSIAHSRRAPPATQQTTQED